MQKQFRRTDSNDSNSSSLASFGLNLLSRTNSKKNQLKRALQRDDSNESVISRGFVMQPSTLATVSSPPASASGSTPGAASVSVNTGGNHVEVIQVVDSTSASTERNGKKDEVAIVVGSRKNSMTKAVR